MISILFKLGILHFSVCIKYQHICPRLLSW